MSELQINTTQNVKIMFTAAGAGERLLAFIIDLAIKIGYLLVVSWIFDAFENMDQWSQIGINTVLSFPVMFYTLALESFLEGQTIGKKALKIWLNRIKEEQKGSTKRVKATKTDYVETALSSSLSGNNINVVSDNNILVQGSDLLLWQPTQVYALRWSPPGYSASSSGSPDLRSVKTSPVNA